MTGRGTGPLRFRARSQLARRLIVAALLSWMTACDSGRATRPDSTVITVRLRDDAGAPAGRNQVIVTSSDGARVSAQTLGDGTADIRVTGAGTFQVHVIPRTGYLPSDALSKNVTLTENEVAVVNFTLFRAGLSTDDPWTREPTAGLERD